MTRNEAFSSSAYSLNLLGFIYNERSKIEGKLGLMVETEFTLVKVEIKQMLNKIK